MTTGRLALGVALVDDALLAVVVALMTLLAIALAPRSWREVGPLGVLLAFAVAFIVTRVGDRTGFNAWFDGVLEGIGYQLDEISTWFPAFVGAMAALAAVATIRRRRRSRPRVPRR